MTKRSPIGNMIYDTQQPQQPNNTQEFTAEDLEDLRKEQETRLLTSFGVESLFLALGIMLYESWSWGMFSHVYQNAIIFAVVAFALQAAIYVVWRNAFEESTHHRRKMKRLRRKGKRRMGTMKYAIESDRQEFLMDQEINNFLLQTQMAQADNYISPNEESLMRQSYANLQQTAQESQQANPTNQMTFEDFAKQFGIVSQPQTPVNPNLNIYQPPVQSFQVQKPAEEND